MLNRTLEKIEKLMDVAIKSHEHLYHSQPFPTCEQCGCLLPLGAAQGKKEIRQRPYYMPNVYYTSVPTAQEDYIYTPHYCNMCAPQKESQEKENK
uniref:Uncharacterized protein n=2 Tax=viral metagenome TaxID=1070528 RepID=A0A6H2A2Z3_9ZZZZ